MNRETLLDILETLSEYVDELKSYRDLPKEKVLGERHYQSAIRYAFQTAIQCVLDAGLHVLVDSGLASPRDNKDIIQALGQKGILPPEFAKRIEGMAGFRNILVHRYFKVDSEIVHRHLQDYLGNFEEFLRRLRSYIEEPGPGKP